MRKFRTEEALKIFSGGKPYTAWAEGEILPGYRNPLPGNAGQRVYSEVFSPRIIPRFRLPRDSRVFTVGSCFARNVERALMSAGIEVVNSPQRINVEPSHLNKYNAFAIWQELAMAIDDSYDESLCLEVKPEKWIDYTGNGFYKTRDALLEARNKILAANLLIREAGFFILTLGLTEAWYDKETGKYLNITPLDAARATPDRYECHVLDYNDNLDFSRRLIELVRRENDHVRIVITVSPVPLVATFTGHDIALRNMVSKSTLRAVADSLINEYEFCDYFPSYEMVVLSKPEAAWMPDRRHVRAELVKEITDLFVREYFIH
ncbi:MAG: GSCFA domain-containing protein [Pseudomonadota bacterium]